MAGIKFEGKCPVEEIFSKSRWNRLIIPGEWIFATQADNLIKNLDVGWLGFSKILATASYFAHERIKEGGWVCQKYASLLSNWKVSLMFPDIFLVN